MALSSLELIDVEDIDITLATEELKNQHAQNFFLDLITDMLDKVPLLDSEELLERVGELPLKLEDIVASNEKVKTIRDIRVFKRPEEFNMTKLSIGISEAIDIEFGGVYKQEFILLGGKRGSGKSIFCANICAAQHKQGKPSMYFTIEMTAEEVMQRILAMLSGVPATKVKNNSLAPEELSKVANTMASLFIGGDLVYEKYFKNNPAPDIYDFQDELQATCKEKDEGRIIIVDDRSLSLATIDTKIAAYKSRYGQDLGMVVLDYINRVQGASDDKFDWKAQTTMADDLKAIARKHDICLVSPYQMDDTGKARFAQGILDAADVAFLIQVPPEKESGVLILETTKARSSDDTGKYPIGIDWSTLLIDPKAMTMAEFNAAIEEIKSQQEQEEAENRPAPNAREDGLL